MSEKAVCREIQTTPGLLKRYLTNYYKRAKTFKRHNENFSHSGSYETKFNNFF